MTQRNGNHGRSNTSGQRSGGGNQRHGNDGRHPPRQGHDSRRAEGQGAGGNPASGGRSTPPTTNRAVAPFNFVPLSDLVYFPPWAASVSQDVPFADGWCGSLEVELTAETPLLVGGGPQKAPTEENIVRFLQMPDPDNPGRTIPVIPGSSTKGMIRNVLEIAGFGKMGRIDQKRFGVRDLTPGGKFYTRQIVSGDGRRDPIRMKVRTGWLRYDRGAGTGGQWSILPADHARVPYPVLKRDWGLDQPSGRSPHRFGLRNKCLGDGRSANKRLACRITRPSVATHMLGKLTAEFAEVSALHPADAETPGLIAGMLVFTGPIAKKSREFVFHSWEGKTPLPVAPEVFRAFAEINGEQQDEGRNAQDSAWGFWSRELAEGRIGPGTANEPGIPVFFLTHPQTGAVTKLGLAQMFKLPYDFDTFDMVRHTSDDHLAPALDLAELMFGTVAPAARENARDTALRSRVSFGHARPVGTPQAAQSALVILNRPKASYYPFYVEQTAQTRQPDGDVMAGDYATYMATGATDRPRLRGWKRYWARPAVQSPLPAVGDDQKRVASRLHPLAAGTRFALRIAFHNLRDIELGALVWCLAFGAPVASAEGRTWFHGLGLGKPFGFGRVSLSVRAAELRPNMPDRPALSGAAAVARLEQIKADFAAHMEGVLGRQAGRWEQGPQITTLRQLADPACPAVDPAHRVSMTLDPDGLNEFLWARGKRPSDAYPWSLSPRALPHLVPAGRSAGGRPAQAAAGRASGPATASGRGAASSAPGSPGPGGATGGGLTDSERERRQAVLARAMAKDK